MRQGHNNHSNNNRRRNRNRKNQNPLQRSYESNGPDVKIRGNPSHIAEKYQTLARDAQSSGDTVSAENYWQHAEHYNRIIMAAQAAQDQQPNQGQQSGQGQQQPAAQADGEQGERRGRRRRNRDEFRDNDQRDAQPSVKTSEGPDRPERKVSEDQPVVAEDTPKPRRRRTRAASDADEQPKAKSKPNKEAAAEA